MNNPLSGTQAAGEPALSIVLVHGAFVDGSGWRQVHSELVDRGFEVLVAQHPTTSLEGDVAATERLIASARHPVLLVGHSYGGAVITEAGANPKVKSLAYIAAFVPDVGESVAALNEAPEEPGETKAPLLAPQDGYLVVDPVRFPEAFAADVNPATTRFLAAAQLPWGLAAVVAPLTHAAWKSKPSFYLVATADRMVPPSAQRRMARRAAAAITEVDSSHAVMMSHPQDVATFIAAAAVSTVKGVGQ
ncbi:alpha/beta hydrolase [Rhizobium laguerreae]|uniref:alpha/beta hydrolase n=1 Tax=Rhizobium laguerreae TaxID=1076926 RepID=UPI00103E8D13|nr:alpha/beta hydrolase [Rhizobium laguerreae]MBY3082275.1 alpha/beta hydrolase [Rhizobium laguerreae]MBY3116244.1 alpha/beta hydrolase [Rhizobium laguerreae]MBY3143687.1 alpha/beta hydrolase [Rhizobium laguerreae]MBY3280092.1 alpha/beta hydrolase [Rhizobium laguerreae]MBY3424929.1 alpha/beta hydrolase [Rhizobium laguerreae]